MNSHTENYEPINYSGKENEAVQNLLMNSNLYATQIRDANFKGFALSHLEGGHMSATFLIESPESKRVLKIYPYDRLAFGEKYVFDQWDKADIPVPRIMSVNFTKSLVPFSYVLMEYISGNSTDFVKLSDEKKRAVLTDIARYLKKAHKIHQDEYGWINFHTDGKGDKTWNDSMENILSGRGKFLIDIGLLDKNRHSLVRKVALERLPEVEESSLLHGDCSINNILLNEENEIAFIDPDPIGGDGLYDLAYLSASLINVSGKDYDSLLLETYLGKQSTQDEVTKWTVYKILSLIRQISASVKKKSQETDSHTKLTKMFELIDSLNNV